MAKRDKNRSINNEWDDWNDQEYRVSKKNQKKARKQSRLNKQNNLEDWTEIDETSYAE